MIRWVFPLVVLALVSPAHGEVVAKTVEYKHGATQLEGTFLYDTAVSGNRPGILLVHESGGISTNARSKAIPLLKAGYAVFTADLYGKGVTPKDARDAAQKAGFAGNDRKQIRERMLAAYELLGKQVQVDNKRLGAIGYGYGGSAVLELARTGAEFEGVVCVHGDLATPDPKDGKKVNASVLAIVGSEDPFIPLTQVAAFEEEMRGGGIDWQLLRLGGVGHDFTNPQAGRNLKSGSAYDADADQRAGDSVRSFFVEMFPAKTGPMAKVQPKSQPVEPKGIPDKVLKVLKFVDDNGDAPDGFEGGRNFLNIEKHLPLNDDKGRRLKYREWDVNPLRKGVNRGAERLVTGTDGSAYYTDDHYKSFKKIR
ncbi:MAG: dienelactone hydrolase family protein [Planctomycetes bacterium]|nr:dienelactone hydrolase family protein [Planctomycetota bacterium]